MRMCDACFRFLVLRKPICVRCAHERRTRARRNVSLWVFVAVVSAVGGWLLARRDEYLVVALCSGAIGCVVGLLMAIHVLRRQDPGDGISHRSASDEWDPVDPSRRDKTRARYRRLVAHLAPTISGRATALITLATMALTAAAFPLVLNQPRWVEFEWTLLAWWTMAAFSLSALLYRGHEIEDDHFFQTPSGLGRDTLDGANQLGGCDPVVFDFADGCEGIVGVAVAALALVFTLLAALFAAWLLVELVIPIVFLTFYVTTLAAIRRAARDRHDCEGNVPRSLRWALTWATLYIAPIATLVWLLHRTLPAGH